MGEEKDIRVLAAPERLDSASASDFKTQAADRVEGASGLIVDFGKTRFVDSVGLGTLVNLLKACNRQGVELVLAALTPQVRQIFELTRLYRLFDVFDTVEQARAALENGPAPAGDGDLQP